LRESGSCGDSSPSCETYEFCALDELQGDAREQCLFDPEDPRSFPASGYCYIEPARRNEDGQFVAGGDSVNLNPVVSHCRSDKRRMIRLVGDETPTEGAAAFVVCLDLPKPE
jgi:hypothetical protein